MEGGSGGVLRFWEVSSFDLTDFCKTSFAPGALTWVYPRGGARQALAVAERTTGLVHLLDPAGEAPGTPFATMRMHGAPVATMAYCPALNVVVSGDGRGVLELWSPTPDSGFAAPPGTLDFLLKSDTDLYAVARAKALPTAACFNPQGSLFAVQSTDGRTHVFTTRTGKLAREFDDSPDALTALAAQGRLPLPLKAEELAARLVIEEELRDSVLTAWRTITSPAAPAPDAAAAQGAALPTVRGASPFLPPAGGIAWDETGSWLLYTCVLGIKVVDVDSGALAGRLGGVEDTERFTSIALYSGTAKVSSQTLLAGNAAALSAPVGAAGSAPIVRTSDPTLLATAFRRSRFYMFSRREPEESAPRDVQNEPPSASELSALQLSSAAARKGKTCEEAVLHTTQGDVFLKLFPADAPKAVENFVTLARGDYYTGTSFHRVIKGFMLQGGDPRGDGTGGESCWGKPFADEIVPRLRFDRPGVLAMANSGPATNGSQFFITCGAATWLDGKHSIFGIVTRGMDVVRRIEGVKVGKDDKPFDDVRVLGVTVK
jgi:peptidylprolyl isomerase domain and WD repeat-containing protein 1